MADNAKWINKQIPIATSVLDYLGRPANCTYLIGGAVIDVAELSHEWGKLSPQGQANVYVHPHAAVVRNEDRDANVNMVRRIASTGKGTGPAAAARMLRTGATYSDNLMLGDVPSMMSPAVFDQETHNKRILVETSQGFSLGINSGFYPYCTHRECTVAQALADARISPVDLRQSMMVVRTYPIRVGNTEGSSGGAYPDQNEVSWEEIGQKPEYTTVTKRVRRIFTWSRIQFREALRVNRPTVVMLNFANYLSSLQLDNLLKNMTEDMGHVYGGEKTPPVLLGFGPATCDVTVAI
jgi:adenylosuccinate synthase